MTSIRLHSYQLRRLGVTSGNPDPYGVTEAELLKHLSKHTWGPATRRSVRSTLRSFYLWALHSGHVKENPALHLPKVRVDTGHPRPAPEDAVRIGRLALDPRVRLMVALAASAGLRCCEIAVLHSSDVLHSPDGWSLRIHGKGGKIRTIPLAQPLVVALQAVPRGYVFPGQIDGHLSAAYVSKLMSAALPDQWTAHTLRHRFASVAYSVDMDIRGMCRSFWGTRPLRRRRSTQPFPMAL